VPLTARARAAFEELHAGRGALPLRGKDLVLAREFELQRPPVRKMAMGSEFTPRRRVENRLTAQFRRVALGLGLEGVSLHTLRHSCASRMVMAGVPLSAVARVTGHSTLRCAALYGRHAPVDAARMAIRAMEEASAPPSSSLVSAGAS
jgi:integrase